MTASTKGVLKGAWRLFDAWKKHEPPLQALPLDRDLLKALVYHLIQKNEMWSAATLWVGFDCCLRSDEMKSISLGDFFVSSKVGALRLASSKTSQRLGSDEGISISNRKMLRFLQRLLQCGKPGDPLLKISLYKFRSVLVSALAVFGIRAFIGMMLICLCWW